MALILTAKQICERSLRQIGAFPVTDSAADGEHLREAMHWLDMLMANTSGVERIFSRLSSIVSLEIENGTSEYALNSALGDELPVDGIQFPVDAYLEDASGNRHPLTIVQRKTFDNVAKAAETGPPKWIYVDRIASNPTLRIYPTPRADDPAEYVIKLVVQQYSPNVAPAGITGTQPSGTILHQFNEAWQLWLVVALSHAIGSGPVFALPEGRLTRLEKWSSALLTRLLAFHNREHDNEEPVCEPYGM